MKAAQAHVLSIISLSEIVALVCLHYTYMYLLLSLSLQVASFSKLCNWHSGFWRKINVRTWNVEFVAINTHIGTVHTIENLHWSAGQLPSGNISLPHGISQSATHNIHVSMYTYIIYTVQSQQWKLTNSWLASSRQNMAAITLSPFFSWVWLGEDIHVHLYM